MAFFVSFADSVSFVDSGGIFCFSNYTHTAQELHSLNFQRVENQLNQQNTPPKLAKVTIALNQVLRILDDARFPSKKGSLSPFFRQPGVF
ncbi:MAG: hypothetical protein U0L49_06225 [Eubacterium sp.]|nr:hypothetical protein [Eubacterium sp.]